MNQVKISNHITWQKMDEYIYIIDERNNRLSFIDDLGMDIWLLITSNCKVNEIIVKLLRNYNILEILEQREISEIIQKFIENLIKEEFIYEY